MSTRAVYTFKEGREVYHVYKHHDGYPSGAAAAITNALPFAWPLPRWEADEFATAFIAGNKAHYINEELRLLRKGARSKRDKESLAYVRKLSAEGHNGGGVRLTKGPEAHGDLEYRYEISFRSGSGPGSTSVLWVRAFRIETDKDALIFQGPLASFVKWADDNA